jgi:hypothetical protein
MNYLDINRPPEILIKFLRPDEELAFWNRSKSIVADFELDHISYNLKPTIAAVQLICSHNILNGVIYPSGELQQKILKH